MRRAALFAVLASAALIAAGCSESSESKAAEPVALDVEMTDFIYEPGEIAVAERAEVTITATNASPFGKHNLLIVNDVFTELVQANDAIEADPGTLVAESGLVEPGESESLVVTFDEPGVYQFYCTVLGHFVAGMHGTITVES